MWQALRSLATMEHAWEERGEEKKGRLEEGSSFWLG
jgi:hypothetical protein